MPYELAVKLVDHFCIALGDVGRSGKRASARLKAMPVDDGGRSGSTRERALGRIRRQIVSRRGARGEKAEDFRARQNSALKGRGFQAEPPLRRHHETLS